MRTTVETVKPHILGLVARWRKRRVTAKRAPLYVPLARAKPEFQATTAAEIAAVMAGKTLGGPIRQEISRLIALYAPVLAPKAASLPPSALLRLDVRCPIERVAASLAMHASLKPAKSGTTH